MNTGSVRSNLRNIAIVAHVDHGKTTLVDQLLRQSGTMSVSQGERVMDTQALEKERGITILAKNTGVLYGDYTINIVDTPGHTDFGGEVERTLQLVEGFLLLVDAAEGVLPGTRFVLQKALQLNLRPIVLINKIDRKDADIKRTEDSIHDLFLDLVTNDSQLDFPVLYGSSRIGFAGFDMNAREGDMKPLFDTIVKTVPAPVNKGENLQFLITSLDYSDFLGSIAVGRVFSGQVRVGDSVILCRDTAVSSPLKVTKLFTFLGLERHEVQEVMFGDIAAMSGFDEAPELGMTICVAGHPAPYPYIKAGEPTLSMYFSVNDSPFNGKEGKWLTSRHLKARLEKEAKTNVALRVEPTNEPETFKVSGRGQLHLGVLIETMRREGFELQVSAPEVIYKTIDGQKCEPIEYVVIDVPEEYQGAVMENLGRRKAELKAMTLMESGRVRLEYTVPSRALLGFRSQFLSETRGTGVISFTFHGYEPYKGDIPVRTKGALVSMENGRVTGYALDSLQDRGILFVKPGDQVYEGMIIGEHSRANDLEVNPCKEKKLTNMRASGSDDAIKLEPPRVMELETCMEWIRPDELIEITPVSIRLRKKELKAVMRKRA
ncbi:MAG TPA: translational GTPase TypA [Candidatus Bathyarchaeia archaeon]|nr:translational GTPase TypA [Candidatus Bathyarchaeia archaeon]